MNALKHMEAVFIVALSLAGAGSYLAATSQDANAAPAPVVQAAGSAPIAVVTVVGKRMSAAEKAQSLRDEAAAANATAARP